MSAKSESQSQQALNPPAWFRGVGHVGWTVSNLDAVVNFYCEAFGAREVYRMGPMAAADMPKGASGLDGYR